MPFTVPRCLIPLLLGLALAAAEGDGHGEEDPGAERASPFGGSSVDGVRAGMVPFVLPWDDGAPGPTDLRFLGHAPAGSRGRVVAGDDGDLYVGDERIRFLGVNLCFKAAVPDQDDAPKIAARMAKFGINLVRFHHIDNPRALLPHEENSRDFDPAALDRLDYLIAELAKAGIYVNLNLLVSRRFHAGDGIGPVHRVKGKLQHLVGFWHEPTFALHAEYARRLLAHRNPYTERTYAEDPAVAFVEIINENGLANTWLSPRRSAFAGSLEDLPAELAAPLLARWRAFVTDRHGDRAAALAAWGLPAASDLVVDGKLHFVPLDGIDGFRARPLALRRDWLAFLRAVERDYYRRMTRVIREELGCRALVVGSTLHSGWPSVMAEMDCIDSHVYWENPRWRKGTWNYRGKDWHILNQSHVDAGPGGRLRWVAMGQVRGKPFSITEFNHSAPNVFAGEAPLYLAVHGALQGWDALYLFNYGSGGGGWDSRMLMGLDVNQHPTKMANLPVAALLFRRGDLEPARIAASDWMSPAKEIEIAATKGSSWNIANGFRLRLAGNDVVRHRIEMVLGAEEPATINPRPDPPPDDRFAISSDHGMLTWDDSDPRGAVLVADTPRTKSVFGMICRRRFALGPVEIIPGQTMDGGGCVSIALLEGEDFARARRALVVATARAENTGMLWKRVIREGSPDRVHWELDSWGEAPTTVEVVPGRIALPGTPETLRVRALDERGRPAAAVPVRAVGPGRAAFDLGGEARTLWYLVEWSDG